MRRRPSGRNWSGAERSQPPSSNTPRGTSEPDRAARCASTSHNPYSQKGEHMAAKTEPPVTTDGKQASVAAIEAAQAARSDPFDWNTLDAPISMPNHVSPTDIKVNVLETVPEPIRVRAEASLAMNVVRVAKAAQSTAKRARVDYEYRVQPVPSVKVGDDFKAQLVKYAKYRPADKPVPHADAAAPKGQVTVRAGNTMYYRNQHDGIPEACDATADGAYLGVRYSVRPLEQRSDTHRLPGTA